MRRRDKDETRIRLLDAGMTVIRAKGYSATTVDELCRSAGVTKGAFFHHFKGKEELAVEAASHFSKMADGFFASAPYQNLTDPRERVLGYIDFRIEILDGPIWAFTCLLGTLVQEVYDSHPGIREACRCHLDAHVEGLAKMLAEAKEAKAPGANWSPEELARYIQVVIQGCFIFSKADNGPEQAKASLRLLRGHIASLLPA